MKILQLNLKRGKENLDLLMQTVRGGGPMCCSLLSNTNGPKTLLDTRMHHGGLRSLFVAVL